MFAVRRSAIARSLAARCLNAQWVMITTMRLAAILSTFVVATHLAAAQPPPGTTDPALKQLMPQATSRATANTASEAPGCSASGTPGNTAPTPSACTGSQSPERSSAFLLGSVGIGSMGLLVADLQLGWMIVPQFGVFASLGEIVVVSDDGGALGIKGLGARLWGDRFFFEARAAMATTTTGCEFDDPCVDKTTYLGAAGAGVELIHSRNFGLELRGEMIFDRRDAVFLGTLGLGFYL